MDEFFKNGNGIQLVGDLRRAGSWIKYAQRQLVNLKSWMRLADTNMGKKYYSVEGGCVDIIINSVAGMDRIWIKACAGGVACEVFVYTSDSTPPDVDYALITVEMEFKKNGTEVETDSVYYHVDFGDGYHKLFERPNSDRWQVDHAYGDTGGFEITVTAWAKRASVVDVISDGKLAVTQTQLNEQRASGVASTFDNAFAAFDGTSWSSASGEEAFDGLMSMYYSSGASKAPGSGSVTQYAVGGQRGTIYTNISEFSATSIVGVAKFSFNHYDGSSFLPVDENALAITSAGVEAAVIDNKAHVQDTEINEQERTSYRVLFPVVAGEDHELMITDSNNWAQMETAPDVDGPRSVGWQPERPLRADFYPYICKAQKKSLVILS